MEAKDTVMGQSKMIRLGGSWGIKQLKVARAQAEISYTLTLKDVGERLEQIENSAWQSGKLATLEIAIQDLKEGKMPEEKK